MMSCWRESHTMLMILRGVAYMEQLLLKVNSTTNQSMRLGNIQILQIQIWVLSYQDQTDQNLIQKLANWCQKDCRCKMSTFILLGKILSLQASLETRTRVFSQKRKKPRYRKMQNLSKNLPSLPIFLRKCVFKLLDTNKRTHPRICSANLTMTRTRNTTKN